MHLMKVPSNQNGQQEIAHGANSKVMTGLLKTYLLVDVLRAIHLHSIPTVRLSEVSLQLENNDDFQSIYQWLLTGKGSTPASLSPDDHVFLLFALLAEIVSLQHSLTALVRPDMSANHIPPSIGSVPRSSADAEYYNPLLPHSASAEYIRCKQRLSRALSRWLSLSSVLPEHGARVAEIDRPVTPVYHFCCMTLEADSKMWLLPALVGYEPFTNDDFPSRLKDDPSSRPALVDLHFSDAASSSAWKILDQIGFDVQTVTTVGDMELSVSPVWSAIILFYAALVVWARMIEDQNHPTKGGVQLSRKKIMGTFMAELEKIRPRWGCIPKMVATLKNLD
ncbi:hypothetical protein LTS17_002090 [Exophiala oligosperma]